MVMTDPIADMLTRIRNANLAYKDEITMPASNMKARIAEILVHEGYLVGSTVERRRQGSQDHDHDEVRPEPRADDHGNHACVEARLRGSTRAETRSRACWEASASLSCPHPAAC